MLTDKNSHLEAENIDVETVALDPGVLVHDIDKKSHVGHSACPEHHCQVVADLYRGVCAAIGVNANSVVEEAHSCIHRITYIIVFPID